MQQTSYFAYKCLTVADIAANDKWQTDNCGPNSQFLTVLLVQAFTRGDFGPASWSGSSCSVVPFHISHLDYPQYKLSSLLPASMSLFLLVITYRISHSSYLSLSHNELGHLVPICLCWCCQSHWINPKKLGHWLNWVIELLPWEFSEDLFQFSSVQSLSCVWLFETPWTAARQASVSITNSRRPPKPMSIESVMRSSHLTLCRPLLLLPSIFHSIRVFSNESALRRRWPKYWSFSLSISPSNEYPGLISFRMDWLDLPAVQGTRKSLLQHHSSKASILWRSAFFTVQLSHPYMTTGKTIALTRHSLAK